MTDLMALAVDEAAVARLSIYHDDLSHMQAATSRFAARMAQEVDERAPIPDVLPFQIVAAASPRHDLRTPLTTVLGHGEWVAEEAREKGHAAMLTPMAEIVTASHRLLDSIDRLVEFSRVGLTDEAVTPRDHTVLSQARDVLRQLVESESRDRTGVIGRILNIDDNVNVFEPLVRRLSREGHQVVACESGEEAFDTISRHPFDVVLFDVMMRSLSGIEVLRKSKANLPDLPIIMISALDEMDMIVRCLEEGAEDYLSKPLNATLLKARITASLGRKFLRDREKTAQARLRLEQKRFDKLLRNLLPDVIVERLRRGEAVAADHFEDVTILFCDLVGFTRLAAAWPPARTLSLLNEIFSGFDELVTRFGLEKIKTIGDACMVAGGLPQPHGEHAEAAATMALHMPSVVANTSFGSQAQLACRKRAGSASIAGRQSLEWLALKNSSVTFGATP